ncbi:hypothetical protein M231_07870 [Tremella mesenterica]|uniref:Uncharacterized protein n=1 Tax=Tremella mesenterica TaxID=5217 RepID=A0A4Q1BFB5_TREME|nr:hypothetical protein M231_07870 [Tremella mesenterica]
MSYSHPTGRRTTANTPRPPLTPNPSFLTPVQEARILSWRQTTSGSPPPNEAVVSKTKPKVKSAPASIQQSQTLSQSHSSNSSCPVHGPCSCNTPHRSNGKKVRGYYSRKKSTAPSSTDTPLLTPVDGSPKLNDTNMGPVPDVKGLPSPQQVQAYRTGLPSQIQPSEVPALPIPVRQQAMPVVKQEQPRIVGSRDPISQNYWKQMFPPVGGPAGVNAGTPYMLPMFGVRPWGY